MIVHAQSSDRVRTVYSRIFKDIQAYSGILMNIQPHSQARKEGRGRREETSSTLFEIKKKCLDFGKKGPDCVHLWLKFSIQNIVSKVSRRKTSKMFPYGTSFSCVFDKIFIKVPQSHNFRYLGPEVCSKSCLFRHIQIYFVINNNIL